MRPAPALHAALTALEPPLLLHRIHTHLAHPPVSKQQLADLVGVPLTRVTNALLDHYAIRWIESARVYALLGVRVSFPPRRELVRLLNDDI